MCRGDEGRLILISSPLGRSGLFFELFQLGFSGAKATNSMFCLRAPSWEVNPTIHPDELEKAFSKDPRTFKTEFGAEFTDRTLGWLERPSDLFACIDEKRSRLTMAPAKRPHYIGFDFGISHDASAIAIVHIEGEKIVVDYVDEIRAGQGRFADQEALDFEGIADWVAALSKKFHFTAGLMDQAAGQPLAQAFAKRGLTMLAPEHITKQEAASHFRNFKDQMYAGALSLYDLPKMEGKEHADYIDELLSLQAEIRSKYVTIVEAPKSEGKTDDRSDALVRAIWVATQHLGKPKSFGATKTPGNDPAVTAQARASMRRARLKAYHSGSSVERQKVKPKFSPSGRSIMPRRR